MKRTPLHRTAGLSRAYVFKRRTPLRPRTKNTAKRNRDFRDHFHSHAFVQYVHSLPCLIRGCPELESVCAHIPSRGAGGTWRDIVNLGPRHHAEEHAIGTIRFLAKYDLDVDAAKALVQQGWLRWSVHHA